MDQIRYEVRPDGSFAARLCGPVSRVLLRASSDCLTREFGAESFETFDGGDQLFWDFRLGGAELTLHWERDLGITLLTRAASAGGEQLVRRLAPRLAAALAASPS